MIERYQTKETAELWSDEKRFEYWLLVEKAVAWAQSRLGIVPKRFYETIKEAKFDTKEIKEFEKSLGHDVIAFLKSIEKNSKLKTLNSKLLRYLHFGLTSYDIVDTTLILMCRKACDFILEALTELKDEIGKLAKKHPNTVMMGRTHGVHAEPITFGFKCLSWFTEVERNIQRLKRTRENLSFGKISGAVGTYSQLPPRVEELALKRLGLKPEPVSTQVIPRDRYAELLTTLAIIGSSLERIGTEIRNLQRTEIGEVEEPFRKGQRGSSAMPHKRNPMLCERICGLARVVRANALVGLENICLWHERDLTNSASERIIIPESTTLIHYMTKALIEVMKNLRVFSERMLENVNLSEARFFSQSLLSALIKKGMTRDEAYELIQELAFKNANFKDLALSDKRVLRYLKKDEIKKIFEIRNLLKNIKTIYQRVALNNRR